MDAACLLCISKLGTSLGDERHPSHVSWEQENLPANFHFRLLFQISACPVQAGFPSHKQNLRIARSRPWFFKGSGIAYAWKTSCCYFPSTLPPKPATVASKNGTVGFPGGWIFDNLTKGFMSQILKVCIQDEDVVEARKVLAQLQVGMRESWNWWENRSNQQNDFR